MSRYRIISFSIWTLVSTTRLAQSAVFDMNALQTLLDQKKPTSALAFLTLIDKNSGLPFAKNATLSKRSGSVQKSTSTEPRVVMWNEDSSMSLTFTGNPQIHDQPAPNYEDIEVHWFRKTKPPTFEFYSINFTHKKPQVTQPRCLNCHVGGSVSPNLYETFSREEIEDFIRYKCEPEKLSETKKQENKNKMIGSERYSILDCDILKARYIPTPNSSIRPSQHPELEFLDKLGPLQALKFGDANNSLKSFKANRYSNLMALADCKNFYYTFPIEIDTLLKFNNTAEYCKKELLDGSGEDSAKDIYAPPDERLTAFRNSQIDAFSKWENWMDYYGESWFDTGFDPVQVQFGYRSSMVEWMKEIIDQSPDELGLHSLNPPYHELKLLSHAIEVQGNKKEIEQTIARAEDKKREFCDVLLERQFLLQLVQFPGKSTLVSPHTLPEKSNNSAKPLNYTFDKGSSKVPAAGRADHSTLPDFFEGLPAH